MNPVRRFAAALRERRWAQVVIELTLLIVGILVALAVDGWIEDRRDVRTEREYLERLQRDLDRDLAVLEEYVAFEDRQVADGIAAYRAMRGAVQPAGREAVAESLTRLMSRRTIRLARSTYTDLVSTGNIRLIRNTALRDQIATLYETTDRSVAIRDRNNQVFVDQMYVQYIMDAGLIAPRATHNIPAMESSNREFMRRVGVPIDTDNDRLWQIGPSSPEWRVLANKVWQRSIVSQQARDQAQGMANDIRAVREQIGEEINRRWPG